ncbi:MAG: hypothetical protein OXG57_12285 [Acidimicrobiaceae bacterium]|nr:hypothetical protein [Acidimicrobiaceae bacterium]MCY3609205.1 hypothetical protein [Acidimicrobiaceae bacterium]
MTSEETDMAAEISAMREVMASGFAGVHTEMSAMRADMDERFAGVDGRLDSVDGRLDSVDGRLDSVDDNVAQVRSDVRAMRIMLGDVKLDTGVLIDAVADINKRAAGT